MTESIHVCIVTTIHAVDDMRVNYKFAQSFREAGFRVTWVGPDLAHFDQNDFNPLGIGFVLFPRAKGRLGRLWAHKSLFKHARKVEDVDVYYAPDPDSAGVAVRLARENHSRSVFDIHEVFHDAHMSFGVWGPRWARPLLSRFIKWRLGNICSACDLVIGVNESVLAPYTTAASETMVARSCAPACFAKDPPSDVCGSGRSGLTLMHGRSSLGRGTGNVLEALSIANKRVDGLRVILFEQFVQHVDGFSRDDFLQRTRELGIEQNVDLRKGIPFREMPGVLRSCDVGMIAWGRGLGVENLPNRLFEYLASGLAVIVPSYSKHMTPIVEQEQCGLVADFEQPESIAGAIVYLREHPDECRAMGQRARKAFELRYNWDREVKPILDWIRKSTGQKG